MAVTPLPPPLPTGRRGDPGNEVEILGLLSAKGMLDRGL